MHRAPFASPGKAQGWRLVYPRGFHGLGSAGMHWWDAEVARWILPQVDEQLNQLQHERADLLKRIDMDQEDLNELMAKHKTLIAQVGAGAASPSLGRCPETPEPGWGQTSAPIGAQRDGEPDTGCCDERKGWVTAPPPPTHSFDPSFKGSL